MEKESARSQTLEQLHERRKQVVRLHKQGIKIMQIVAMTALSYPTVRAAIDLYEAGGWSAVRPALRGRSRGDGRVLSQAQEDTIQRMIIDKRPEQLKMDFLLFDELAYCGPAPQVKVHLELLGAFVDDQARNSVLLRLTEHSAIASGTSAQRWPDRTASCSRLRA